LGASAVNLVCGDQPADVYSGIAARYLSWCIHVHESIIYTYIHTYCEQVDTCFILWKEII